MAAATSAASCASTSRSTATTSSWPRSRRWHKTASCPPSAWPRPLPNTASRPTASTRCTPETGRHTMALIEIQVPDIGDFDAVTVIELLVKPGDTVQAEQSLITVESDKASMEIPSSHAGVVQALRVQIGDQVKQGSVVLALEVADGAAAAPAAAAPAPASAPDSGAASASPATVSAPKAPEAAVNQAPAAPALVAASAAAPVPAHQPTAAPTGKLPHASPSVRKFARELGVPLAEVAGTGPKGRITQADVQAFTQSVMSGRLQTQAQAAKAPAASAGTGVGLDLLPWPKVDFAKFGAVERKELSRIKKISGANLHRNWVMIPHVTNNDEADITELEAFRVSTNKENEKSGVKVTMLAFVIKAVVAALKKFPEFNASLDGDTLVYKQYFHIGFAADTPNGLVVPVLKNADQKGILQISAEMSELAKKARDGKLGAADMQGGSMSISSLGGIGGTHFTPIINAPEVAILGLSKGQMKPVWDGKQFVPRLTLPLSLSYDHRVIDGALAARFNAYLGQVLADYRRILL
ncbi:dihydrolipoyllysine-residue acetyltransferase [Simplicispira metamorpha]|nr:dihydrolipoyllysine-residue acetyltransferase [Simplicispira metamorpha]